MEISSTNSYQIWLRKLMQRKSFQSNLQVFTAVATEFRLRNKNKTGFSLKDLFLMLSGKCFSLGFNTLSLSNKLRPINFCAESNRIWLETRTHKIQQNTNVIYKRPHF